MKKFLSLLMAFIMVLSLVACGGNNSANDSSNNSSNNTSNDSANTEQSGGETTYAERIVIARPQDSTNLDPVTCVGNTNIWIFNLVVDSLVKTSDDGKSIEPNLAESWTVSDDNLTYTFKLVPGVKFSDGTPVTAADWEWSLNRAIETTDGHWYFAAKNIEKVEAPDDTTVIITLKEASAATMANLSMFSMSVQSKAYFEKVGAAEYENAPMGTGPYFIKEWVKGESITLEANPYYRHEGYPKTKEIVFKVVSDDNARAMQLQAGEIDIATYMAFSSLKQMESDSNVKTMALPSTVTRFMALNTAVEGLNNEKVRKAINLATDNKAITAMVLYGYGEAALSFLQNTSAYLNTDIPAPAQDIEAAKQLMAEAGYADGLTIDMLYHAGNAFEEQIATILKEQWAQIGVNVELRPEEQGTYLDVFYGMQFDTVIDYWSDDTPDPLQFIQSICVFDLYFGFDTNYQNPRLEELNALAAVEMDDAKRHEYYDEVQQIIHDAAIFVPLCSEPYGVAVRSNVEGFVQTPLGNYRFDNLVKAN